VILPSSVPSETPLCSDSTTWYYNTSPGRDCGWVFRNQDDRCSLSDSDGVSASDACPIACTSTTNVNCIIPTCNNSRTFWKTEAGTSGKGCNAYLKQGNVDYKCGNLGVKVEGTQEDMFTYETCDQCDMCVPLAA